MAGKNMTEGMLSPFRVLDLTDQKGFLCGKLLGDLGADVIKIERPGGDAARRIGPFYHDEPDPEKSLFWWAFNSSKRGVCLDIEVGNGQETLKKLVEGADFLVESFAPGYLDKLGLGYPVLEKINPGLIMVSITPFGQTGPYKDYKGPDIVAWAMGGQMYPWGDVDRPPVRISHHSQAYLHAASEAATGALLALRHRQSTGMGQHVDVSIQEAVIRVTYAATASWDMLKVNQQRGQQSRGNAQARRMWPCKDGDVAWFYFGGSRPGWDMPLLQWMESEGLTDDFLRGFDWETFDWRTIAQDVVDRLEEPVGRFFMTHTKAELLEGALKYRTMLYPVSTARDIVESTQLASRGFWVELEHPELGMSIPYPGAFARTSEAPITTSRRAPLIGEHNHEILEKEPVSSAEGPLKNDRTRPGFFGSGKESQEENPQPNLLEGIKVVDFTWNIVGPLTTRALADYGAEVIKVESNNRPDPHRMASPHKDDVSGLNRSGNFAQDNNGKLSIALNLGHPDGVKMAKRLVARADVVVQSFTHGVMERLGLGYEELKQVKPDVIMLSTCMQGHTGPYASHPGLGYHLVALCGTSHITGWPDRQPPFLGPYTDYVAPHFNVLAILAALDYRSRTGRGQHIEVSQYENCVHFMAPIILDYVVNGRIAGREGNRYAYAAPHNAYRCRGEDRWCTIAVLDDEEWESFCKVVGSPSWSKDPKFSRLSVRKQNEDELDRLVEKWTTSHSAEEVMNMMQAAGVPAGLVQTGEDLLEKDPQLKHRHFFRELDHPEIGKHYARGPSFVLSKSPWLPQRCPLLGEHNEYILKELLGMSDEEIAELTIEGVLD
jgi:crotonobetainyl-CoA:carnitine CoA-transferase CaiB-like acyl-CoA transferase